jgi:hypothetical protein
MVILPDGKQLLKFRDNTLNVGNNYTYCLLDKNGNLESEALS